MNEDLRELFDLVLFTPIRIGVLQLPFTLLDLLLRLILPLLAVVLAYKLLLGGMRRCVDRMKLKEESAAAVKRWVRIVLRVLYVLAVLTVVGRLFGARIFEYLGIVVSALNQPIIQSGSTNITFITIDRKSVV